MREDMILGQDAGKQVCEAIGLDSDLVSGILIDIQPNDFVMANINMSLTKKQVAALSVIIRGKINDVTQERE